MNTIEMKDLDDYIRKNVDKKDLESNYLDGHGYEKVTNKTVYMINDIPTVFDLEDSNPNKDRWFYTFRTLKVEDIILWKDFNKKNKNLKMESRF